jgi:PadR family transcriptional regulator, regulatory protein PadR
LPEKSFDQTSGHGITVTDIAQRNMSFSPKEVSREILLAFWKVHILHHASEKPLHGQWMLTELNEHGYQISPGTLYPLLARMERLGWLKSRSDRRAGPRARKDYRLTAEGKKVLEHVREQIEELYDEVVVVGKKARK